VSGPRQNLHVRVVESLGERIVHGVVAPATILSVEDLEVEFGASRTAIREALKVLSAKGLVGARPRRGTYVEPAGQWNVFDLDVMRWRGSGPFDARLLRDLAQLRRIVEPGAAELAAINRGTDDLERIMSALEGLGRDTAVGVDGHVEADIDFHTAVLNATGNELLRSLRVVLEPSLRIRDRLMYRVTSDDPYEAHAAVAYAIEDSDPQRARDAMDALLADAERSIELVLSEPPGPDPGN